MERTEWDKEKNRPDVEGFFTKIGWKIYTGEIPEINTFQVDVYEFVMQTPLTGSTLEDFINYIKTLDMTKLRSTMRIFVWLYQHEVYFRLRFGWNRRLSVKYNLKNLFMPMKVRRQLFACGHDDLMTCPLEEKSQKEGE